MHQPLDLSGSLRGRRRFMQGLAAGFAAMQWSSSSMAAESGPVRVVLGFSAGGGADNVARLIGASLSSISTRPVVIENRAGAGGRIAVMNVKSAEPDGSAMFFGSTSVLTLFPHVFEGLQYDLERDFTPVSTACSFPYAMVISPTIGVKNLAEFGEWAKANPQRAFFGTPGVGTPQHLIGGIIARKAGFPLEHAPFKSGGEATQQLLSGNLPVVIATAGQFFELHRSGKVLMIATTGQKRPVAITNVPTMKELGYPDMVFEDSFGFIAPAHMPAAAVGSMSGQIAQAVNSAPVQRGLKAQDLDPLLIAGADYADYLRAERKRWGKVVEELQFKLIKE